MLLPYPTKYRKRRARRGRPVQFGPPPVGLMVIAASAVEAGGELEVTLTFNTSAEDPIGGVSGADASKWTARFAGQRYEGTSVGNDTDTTIIVYMSPTISEAGPDVISYAGPSDISDLLGRELQPFANMPLEG